MKTVSALPLRAERVGGSVPPPTAGRERSAAGRLLQPPLFSSPQDLVPRREGQPRIVAMAPRKRSSRGISFIFCCFRSSDHPEITYRLRNDSSFALQTMEPSLPMPPVEELDAMFTELVVSGILLNFSASCGASPSFPSIPSL